ncbi:MAG: NTP transferase domain-containing protein [Bdellovibrionaceae bacterium]|nr:NTP transferase domain-containing protein [Pseudobdellovibrionaceae bacterium]MBX3033763.1 NTP transferase domain-containing protein [Pseudobdellovibrionaceae bacterium]
MNLMLLCAGEGTRLRPHTLIKPKPAIPFLGVPLAAYALEWAREIGVKKLVVNTHHLADQIHSLFHGFDHGAREVLFSDEQPLLLGTGGGVQKAAAILGEEESFLLMNGDEVFLPSHTGFLTEALRVHRHEHRAATLFVMNHPGVGHQFGGIWTDSSGKILGVGKNALSGSHHGWHYIGAAILSKRILQALPEGPGNILHDGVMKALAEGARVAVHPVEGWWHETGNESDLLEATRSGLEVLRQGPAAQKSFLSTLLDRQAPGWSWRAGQVPCLVLPGASVDSSVEIADFAVIGRRTRVEAGARLHQAVVGENLILRARGQPTHGLILS